MGRLTLNVLLSFAQFEREVTSERIRDKIATSKRKGLWVGGNLPLGYEMKDDKVTVIEDETERVRLIYSRYLELGGVNALVRDLRERKSEPNQGCSRRGQPGATFTSAEAHYSIYCATLLTPSHGKVGGDSLIGCGCHRVPVFISEYFFISERQYLLA